MPSKPFSRGLRNYRLQTICVMQFREACYTVVSYAPYLLLQIYTLTILATLWVTIFELFHPGPQPIWRVGMFLQQYYNFVSLHLAQFQSDICSIKLEKYLNNKHYRQNNRELVLKHMRESLIAACEQQKHRPACFYVQSK